MQQISNLPVFTGTIPNKATQNDTDFANNIFGFLNYSGNSFVTDFNSIVGQFNTLSGEIQTAASSASQSAQSAANSAQSAAQSANAAEFTTGLLAAGTINNIVIGADKTFSNEFLLTLLDNPIDIEEINISAASDINRDLADNDLMAIHNSVNQTTVKSTVSRIWTYISEKLTGAISTVLTTDLTSLKVLISDINGKIVASGVSLTTLNYLGNVTSDIQTQINAKQASLVSGTNLKNINGISLLGSGTLNIEDRLGSVLASAATTTIGTAGLGDYFHISGTTTITSFGTATTAGTRRTLIFDGALTITHHSTNLICPGATSITTVAGMVIEVIAETTTTWRIVSITHPSISPAELGYLDGVTSSIQTQLNGKLGSLTSSDVGTATAGLAFNTIGSYAFLHETDDVNTNAGATKAGSSLNSSNVGSQSFGSTVSGTWRCMGLTSFNGVNEQGNTTLWLRIA